MEKQSEILSFLDMLDLDEYLVDSRLKSLMNRSNYTNKHLSNAMQLLQYKLLINIQENTDCENVEEINFIVKLINEISQETAENICKIINTVLSLNNDTMISNSEHLLQQILPNLETRLTITSEDSPKADSGKSVLQLRICDSILDVVIKKGVKISLGPLNLPLELMLKSSDEPFKVHFITSTVPKLFEGVMDYNVLDNIWSYIMKLQGDNIETSLKVLSCLSDYYLPAVDNKGNIKFESTIIDQYEFWNIVLFGLMSLDFTFRKISVYLAKRAIDYISITKKSIKIKCEDKIIFTWDHKKSTILKSQWDNYFILIDSLEEKQSNIVIPSLQLFDTVGNIENCWLNCAFNLGLKHDNLQVRLKCIEHRLKVKINDYKEATVLLEALDDFNMYENKVDSDILKHKLSNVIKEEEAIILFLKAIPLANMTPIPLYHMTDMLAKLDTSIIVNKSEDLSRILLDLLKVSCNIIAMRKAVHINILQFVGRFCKEFNWRIYANIATLLQIDLKSIEQTSNAFIKFIKEEIILNDNEKKEFYNYICKSHLNIDFGMLYIENHDADINLLIELLSEKCYKVQDIVNRQYSNKLDCFNDVVYLFKLLEKCNEKDNDVTKLIKGNIENQFQCLLHYMFNLLTSDAMISVDDTHLLFSSFELPNKENNYSEILLNIYKNSVLLLKDPNADLERIVLAVCFINNLSSNKSLQYNFKHEMLNLNSLVEIVKIFEMKKVHDAKSVGRLRNMFYEKHCETVYLLIKDDTKINSLQDVVVYIENVTESGGYGCLKWILRIMNQILKDILNTNTIHFDVNQFIKRMWREIEELKTNPQYNVCMKEFVAFITQDVLLEKPEYNNIVILYCNSLIEYGPVKNSPLYYLVRVLKRKDLKKYGHLLYVLSEILLYCPVPRKDQRITDNLAVDILRNANYGVISDEIDIHFNYEIQCTAISILSKITDDETLDTISSFITSKIDNIFKAKLRYHGNSQVHRTLQTALQHLLFILLLRKDSDMPKMVNWCLDLLGRLPHQTSVRICFEWYISLYYYFEKQSFNENLLSTLKSKNLSMSSQFMILYWILKRRICDKSSTKDEYEFVLDTLLSHTMGQMFNVRLLSQYLASELHKTQKNSSKYDYTIEIINKTLQENSTDKNFVKLKEDYFANNFDVVRNFSPHFIYHALPKICEVNNNERISPEFVKDNIKEINENLSSNGNNKCREFRNYKEDYSDMEFESNVESIAVENVESVGTIQKKYIPWKSMSDVNVYNMEKKRESPSELIVVASLIDKLPNLGGMARTGEVFGVKTYVIDSLRHLQDRQFQGLSVSAERWIDVEEVRPGAALKEFLLQKKAEGYSIIAAEQTSTSCQLQEFKFPQKTLLLLGHEKEGIPCSLLPLTDRCVEIPQRGVVRSLNVHVTAAIFLWEYARQRHIV